MHAVAALEQQRVSCAAGLLQRSDERIVRGKGPCPGKARLVRALHIAFAARP